MERRHQGVVGSPIRAHRRTSGVVWAKADVEGPESLGAAIVWLKSLITRTFSMNEEGFRRLKTQFDRMYEAHLEKFDAEIAGFAGDDPKQTQRFLAAKDILGHLLAVSKCVERILFTKLKPVGAEPARQDPSRSLSQSLHNLLVKELRDFCAKLTRTPPTALEPSG